MSEIQRRAVYSGRVQGVGFRARVLKISEAFQVKGFVRNMPDGNVELIVEGAPTEIEKLMTAIREKMKSNISAVEVSDSQPQGFTSFEIRH